MKRLALIIAVTVFSTRAFGEGAYHDEEELRSLRAVWVHVEDAVSDGCLPNPNALKVQAELVLRQSGIRVVESEQATGTHALIISPLGAEHLPGKCVVAMDLQMFRYAELRDGRYAVLIAYEDSGIWYNHTKASMQEALRSQVSEFVSDLANEILKAQGN